MFDRLIRFYVSEQVCVQTWDDGDVAVIKGKGCVLGVVSTGVRYDHISYSIRMTAMHLQGWYFRGLPPLTKERDIVCLLQGASEATIIRAYVDYCAVVAIGFIPKHASPSSGSSPMMSWEVLDKWHDILQSVTVYPRDFLLVWDRQKPWRDSEDSKWLEDNRIPKYAKKQLEGQLSKLDRLQHLGPILLDSPKLDQALYLDMKREQEVQKTERALAAADGILGRDTWLGFVIKVFQTFESCLSRVGRCIAKNRWQSFSIQA